MMILRKNRRSAEKFQGQEADRACVFQEKFTNTDCRIELWQSLCICPIGRTKQGVFPVS